MNTTDSWSLISDLVAARLWSLIGDLGVEANSLHEAGRHEEAEIVSREQIRFSDVHSAIFIDGMHPIEFMRAALGM